MFDFGNANENQRKAIATTEGPVLITAGPGTGKTYTLVQRAIYLIQECGVKPEEILIATFTEKAAQELVTRITSELATRNIQVNVNEMYIGTFHSICMQIIKENLEYTRLKKNFRLLDAFDQQYLVYRNMSRFSGINSFLPPYARVGGWRQAGMICNYVNSLTEEMVDVDAMAQDSNPAIAYAAEMMKIYHGILEEENLIDFSFLQTECYHLLAENKDILDQVQAKVRYLMIDEYQDTNYIQEQLVFLLAGENQNICVVGDDDQGLYRFRGASIRNILEFPSRFPEGKCQIIPLVVNYRSEGDIIRFYNKWMTTTSGPKFMSGSRFQFQWGRYRYDKEIVPYQESDIHSPCVVTLDGFGEEMWHKQVLNFLHQLKESGKLTDYNQIAFLFRSVKNLRVKALASYLEANGISVYSPRSDMFFQREEVMLTLGFLKLMFPSASVYPYPYYQSCQEKAQKLMDAEGNEELRAFILDHASAHAKLTGTTDYAYTGLLYQMFSFEPFRSILDTDLGSGIVDSRPLRNLAMLTRIIGKYEYLYRVDVLDGKLYQEKRHIDRSTEVLFNSYLRLQIDEGIREYEDESEYSPSGCVSFFTIHQAKGMEFPIVFVDSLESVPRKETRTLVDDVKEKYSHRSSFEPEAYIKYFDFWRLYYTAFSRAQNLLVLTCNTSMRAPSKYFSDHYYYRLDEAEALDLKEFTFKAVKKTNLKDTYSFTSHISAYETCALQYKFYRELGFMPVRMGTRLFGTLVRETIEDIHHAAIRHEEDKITPEKISDWFNSNYESLIKTEHGYLAEPQRNAALKQVLRYAERQAGKWDTILHSAENVSLVQQDYILVGNIDIVKGAGDTVELIDFKAEKKPDPAALQEQLEASRRQLQVYAYLVEQQTSQEVSKVNLYYTGEESDPVIAFPYTEGTIEETVTSVDETAHRIIQKDFDHRSSNPKTCSNCDFRFYCNGRG